LNITNSANKNIINHKNKTPSISFKNDRLRMIFMNGQSNTR